MRKPLKNAIYPYRVFSAQRISEIGERQVYVLEVNVWDQNQYYTRADALMDELEKKTAPKQLYGRRVSDTDFQGGSGQHIP